MPRPIRTVVLGAVGAALTIVCAAPPPATAFKFTDATLKQAARGWCQAPKTARTKHGAIGSWDTSQVKTLAGLFAATNSKKCSSFNADINKWNVKGVTSRP